MGFFARPRFQAVGHDVPPPHPRLGPPGSSAPRGLVTYREEGSGVDGVVIDRRQVALPASYTTGGVPVDLSADYGRVSAVVPVAVLQAGVRVRDGRLYRAAEAGADLFSAGRFRLVVELPRASHTPSGVVGTPVFTGDAVPSHQHGVAGAHTPSGVVGTPVFTGDAVPSHQHGVAGAHTPSGVVGTPVFTGDAVVAHTHTYDKPDTPVSTPVNLPGGGTLLSATDTVATGGVQGVTNAITDPTAIVLSIRGHTHQISRDWLLTHKHDLAFTSTASGSAGGHTPTGTVSAPSFTGDSVPDHQHGAAGGHTPTGGVSAPSFTGDSVPDHQHGAAGGHTPTGGVSAPSFTGDPVAAAAASEVAAGTDLSAYVVEVLVFGVSA